MIKNNYSIYPMVLLKDVCKVKGGFAFKTSSYKKTGIPLVRITNISENKVNLDKCVYVDKSFISSAQDFLLKKGDILIALSGATTGKFGIYNLEEIALLNQRIGRLHFENPNKIYPKFVYYYMSILQAKILKEAYGAAQPNISPREIADFPIPLPPLPEQKKIVEKIEELFSSLDSGVASLKKAKEQIKLYRQSVLAAAFSGQLTNGRLNGIQKVNNKTEKEENSTKLPEGWKWVKLGEVTRINPKLPFEEIDNNTIVSFLPMKQVEELNGKFDLSMERKYKEVKKGFTPFTNGDVIFAKITPCMENGKIAVVNNLKNKIGFGSTEFHVCRVYDILINNYLFYYFIQDSFRAKAKHNMTGAVGQKRVPKRFLEEFEIPLPPINQQSKIVSEIEKRFSGVDNLEKSIDYSLGKAEQLRQSILKQAFEGKLL